LRGQQDRLEVEYSESGHKLFEIVRHLAGHDLNPAKRLSDGGKEDKRKGSLTLSAITVDQTRSLSRVVASYRKRYVERD